MAGDSQNTDGDRFTQLFKSEYTSVLAYCARRVGIDDAEAVASQVFSIAWRRVAEIDWATARPWLYGVARGVISNKWRSKHRSRNLTRKLEGLAPPAPTAPDLYAARREEDEEIVALLKRLSVNDQEILMLAAWEGLTPAEIAVALGISAEAALQRLHRAKKRFARNLHRFESRAIERNPARDGVMR